MRIAQTIEHHLQSAEGHPSITLRYEQRFLRRKRLTSDEGISFLVELGETVSLNAGDAFVLDDQSFVVIAAAVEPLFAIYHDDLARIAWHIGNRHTPCQITATSLIIQRDHVLQGLLERLGARIDLIDAPFTPEGGAYGHGRTHGHHHDTQDGH
jgi:urease accessory protein